jgi:hypothetical protein
MVGDMLIYQAIEIDKYNLDFRMNKLKYTHPPRVNSLL